MSRAQNLGRGILLGLFHNSRSCSGVLVLLPGLGRLPRRRLARNLDLGVQLVDLLQAEALCLVDEEVDVGDAQEAGAEPHEEDLGLQVGKALAVVDQVRRGVGNGPVEQPVGGRGHAERLGPRVEREDLARDDPRQGPPGAGEEEDEDAHKCHGGLLPDEILDEDVAVVVLARGQRAAERDDELRDAHADGAKQEQRAAAPSVNGQEARDRGGHVDGRRDHGNGEAAGDARVLEVARAVVEDEVDARQLLQGLKSHAGELALEDRGPEAVQVAGLAEPVLIVQVGLDLAQLRHDGRVVMGKAPHA